MNKRILHILSALALTVAGAAAEAVTVDSRTCVAMALDSSADLRVAVNSREQARLQQGVARTAYLPNFAGSAMGISRMPDQEMVGMTINMKAMWLAGINLTQPIYAGGKIVAANKMADIGVKAADHQMRMTRAEVIANAQQAYWTLVAVRAKVKMMQSYVAQIDTAYSQTRSALDAGMVTRNDLQRIEARRSQVLYQLGRAESGADLSRMNLCHVIGVPADTEIITTDAEVEIELPDNLGDYNVLDRPEAALLQCDVDAKQRQVQMTRGDFLPSLGLVAGWSAYGNIKVNGYSQNEAGEYEPFNSNVRGQGWSILASLSVPLWHWGEGIKKVKHARIEAENARILMDDKLDLMNLEVRQAISNVNTGRGLLEAAKVAMTEAETNLRNITASYDLGLCPLTDLLDAQSQWQASASDLIEATTQLRIHCVEYLRVTARL